MSLCAIALVATGASVGKADVVTEWNDMLMAGIRTTTTWSPPQIAGAGALVQTAVYDAVNSVMGRANPYKFYQPSASADARAAASEAAYVMLSNQFGTGAGNAGFQAQLDAKRTQVLNSIPNSASKTAGMTLGQTIAQQTINYHALDGIGTSQAYTPPNNAPGQWRPDYNGGVPGVGVGINYATCRPWAMDSQSQFRPAQFSPINSATYTNTFNRVKDLGAWNSPSRTLDQSKIAWFWGNDRNGTYKPPGQYNGWARTVANARPDVMGVDGTSDRLFNNARLLALINIAQADAGIAAWDCKYRPDGQAIWRPITAIRNGGTGGAGDADGNPSTVGDPNWEPYAYRGPAGLPAFTPPFPGYISGHSTFGAATGAVLQAFFGDNVSYDLTTDDLDYLALNGGVNTRHYDSISQAILDNAMSREYLGVHFDQDDNEGVHCGLQIGTWALTHALQIPAPSAGALALGAGLVGLRRRRR
jgi:membrane-associated phospholipid phosphatase